MRAAPAEHDSLNGSFTYKAWLSRSHVHPVLKLEESFTTFCIYVVGNRRSAEFDGFFQHFFYGLMEPCEFDATQSPGLAARSDAGAKQRFIGVYVSYSVKKTLIQESGFDWSSSSAKKLNEFLDAGGQRLSSRSGKWTF
jgi:hypothetical protein